MESFDVTINMEKGAGKRVEKPKRIYYLFAFLIIMLPSFAVIMLIQVLQGFEIWKVLLLAALVAAEIAMIIACVKSDKNMIKKRIAGRLTLDIAQNKFTFISKYNETMEFIASVFLSGDCQRIEVLDDFDNFDELILVNKDTRIIYNGKMEICSVAIHCSDIRLMRILAGLGYKPNATWVPTEIDVGDD